MRNKSTALAAVLACSAASTAVGQQTDAGSTIPNGLQIEIQSPAPDFVASSGEKVVEVEGVASTIGGVRYLDMIFVMDTSTSLRSTDPKDYRSAGAIGLVEEGDIIEIDIPNRSIRVVLDDEVLAERRAAMEARGDMAWKPVNRDRFVSQALQAYAAMTTSAARGAVRDISQLKK